MPSVSLIVAADEAGGIGVDNRLPWRLASDLRRFKHLTMGHHLILGRRTFESLDGPLPGRQIIVLTRDEHYSPSGALVAHSLDEALKLAAERGDDEVFIGGGAQVYALALDRADRIYLTRVHTRAPADTFFPAFDPDAWSEIHSEYHPASERDQYPFTFILLEKARETNSSK